MSVSATLSNLTGVAVVIYNQLSTVYTLEQTYLKESVVNITMSTTFMGLFTVLVALAAYVLFSKGIKRKTTAFMLVAISAMWMSTVAYWIGTLVAATQTYTTLQKATKNSLDQAAAMEQCLFNTLTGGTTSQVCLQGPLTTDLGFDYKTYNAHNCVGTAALAVNVVIGDSIVWWRAWVVWPDNLIVRWVGIIMIVLTAAMGIMDVEDTCQHAGQIAAYFKLGPAVLGTPNGTTFSGDMWGLITGSFSLLTNVVATAFIAYRAWEHRRTISTYLKQFSARTQAGRTLALLVESGLLYCALWILIVVYEFSFISLPIATSTFANSFHYAMEGCVVPLIGMYPTLVIIICAVDQSLHEKQVDDRNGQGRVPSLILDPPLSGRRETLSELMDWIVVPSA